MSDSFPITLTRKLLNIVVPSIFCPQTRSVSAFVFLFLSLILCLSASLPSYSQDRIAHIVVRGPFDASMRHFVRSRLREAERSNPDHILLDIQSRSGRIDYVLDIVDELNRRSTPVSIYVSGRLEGPAVMLALSGNKLFMHPNAHIQFGSAVTGSTRSILFRNGYASELASRFASIAKHNGYPADVARAIINPSLQLKWVPGSEKKLITGDRLAKTRSNIDVTVRETVSKSGEPLSLPPGDAKRFGLSETTAPQLNDILTLLRSDTTVNVSVQTMDWPITLTITRILTGYMSMVLFIILGTITALLEIRRPGTGWAGGIAVGSFGLPVITFAYLGLVPPPVMILLLIGLSMFALDTLLVPGISILGFLGLLPTLCSIMLARNSFLIPDVTQSPWEVQYLFDSFSTSVISLGIGIAIYSALLQIYSEQLFTLTLIRASRNASEEIDPEFTPDQLIGTRGTVRNAVRPIGTIVLNGHLLHVVTQDFYLEPDTEIEIQNVEGLRLTAQVQ